MWGQGNFNGGYGGGQGFIQGGQGFGGGQGLIQGGQGFGGGISFNRWANPNCNYQGMNGYQFVDYSNGWNANTHDQMLRNNIDIVFQRYDRNFSHTLEGQ
jgi:hypothetical protein